MHCPTWNYYYSGYRKFLAGIKIPFPVITFSIRWYRPLKRFLKTDKERVFYMMGEQVICSFENYAYLKKQKECRIFYKGEKMAVTKKVIEAWGWQIVVLQRGWVVVGEMTKEGNACTLNNASVIRKWGTTNGLPELAASGPLLETKLEKATYPIRFHYLTSIMFLECSEQWNS